MKYHVTFKFSKLIGSVHQCDRLLDVYRLFRTRWSPDTLTIIKFSGETYLTIGPDWSTVFRTLIQDMHGQGLAMTDYQWAHALTCLQRQDREERGVA